MLGQRLEWPPMQDVFAFLLGLSLIYAMLKAIIDVSRWLSTGRRQRLESRRQSKAPSDTQHS